MRISHTVHTDDGSLRLDLGDGDSIFDLVACGGDGRQVTVYLGHHEAGRLLAEAGAMRVAAASASPAETSLTTQGGVDHVEAGQGRITFASQPGAGHYTMSVTDGTGAHTALTVRPAAHDSLIVGVATILSQI